MITDDYLNLTNLFTKIKKSRILIIGEVMLDKYWHGSTSRISPEAPVPVVHVDSEENKVGGSGNVAMNCASLGAKTSIISFCGDDDNGYLVNQILKKAGVKTYIKKIKHFTTITKLRILSKNQQLIRSDFEMPLKASLQDNALKTFQNKIHSTDVVIISDYGKGLISNLKHYISAAKAEKKIIIVDPKGTDFRKYKGSTILTPNMSEFEEVVGSCKNLHEIELKAKKLIKQLSLNALLITRSEKGMTLVEKGKKSFNVPALAKDVYDVTGAGDTVVSVLASCLGAGITFRDSVVIANIAASIVVGKVGTSTVSPKEIINTVPDNTYHINDTKRKIIKRIIDLKQSGKKIVFTNGCFDILHPGHLSYLREAKNLGDILVIGLNSDTSVRRLKGTKRPINKQKDRSILLQSLSFVDYVIPFSEDTPKDLIEILSPDILVKGGDYKIKDIEGADHVIKNNGKVKILDFIHGYSSSNIIEKIKRGYL
jgi:D-beta-D-heptose 7-phosphate kinase/D-beta-D-heptose 1-phosphate adenosyltransferase